MGWYGSTDVQRKARFLLKSYIFQVVQFFSLKNLLKKGKKEDKIGGK